MAKSSIPFDSKLSPLISTTESFVVFALAADRRTLMLFWRLESKRSDRAPETFEMASQGFQPPTGHEHM
ncbi:hypothetical protein F441_04507 [Phytophthora nicotianae CJ01A1]|uniref:Uncharacterized protein n=1 Tax=Phytophthora nicotianae CJ01A1 TaxID=1317063 RepID=W2XGU6_PHYNI|nr:hypothetical protein F441_04507 [Phytophthora nicotianae CJ01A1]